MRKLILCIFILSFTYAQNVVAESDSTKVIALDAVEVLAEAKVLLPECSQEMLNQVML